MFVCLALSTNCYEGHNNQLGYCDTSETILIILHKMIMIYQPIDIIWHYLILFILLLEVVNLNLNVKKDHMEFWGSVQCCTTLYISSPSPNTVYL